MADFCGQNKGAIAPIATGLAQHQDFARTYIKTLART
jgi:hypothetical protein